MSDDLEFDPLAEDEFDPLNPRAKKAAFGDDELDEIPLDDLDEDLELGFGLMDDEEAY